jgi:uncharacterized protein YfdQ (DUF2303 family)
VATDPQKVESDIRVAYDAGTAMHPVHPIEGLQEGAAIVVKDGFSIKSLSEFDKLRERPRRLSGTVTTHTPQSFIDYVERFHDANTVITADLLERKLSAVLNYHEANGAGARWGDHRVVYQVRETPEWITWNGAHDKPKSQEAFAQFIEENIPDIATPPGAVILELAENLQVKKEVTFSGKVNRTTGGRQLLFDEAVEGSARKGEMKIPDEFTLGIAPFEGSEPQQLKARLRYRVDQGRLSMWVSLDRPHKLVEAAFDAIVAKVENAFGTLLLIHGKVG